VTVYSSEGPKTISVDEQKTPPLEHGFLSLGVFRFDANKAGAVVVSDRGTTGHVAIDAIQVVPVN
jgi:hypothetical protein